MIFICLHCFNLISLSSDSYQPSISLSQSDSRLWEICYFPELSTVLAMLANDQVRKAKFCLQSAPFWREWWSDAMWYDSISVGALTKTLASLEVENKTRPDCERMACRSWLQGFPLVHVDAEQFCYVIKWVPLVLRQSRGFSVFGVTIWEHFLQTWPPTGSFGDAP